MDTDAPKFEQSAFRADGAHPNGGREPYLTQEFKQRLDLIRHLVANSDRVPVVNGPHGSGKSTLLDKLHDSAPPEWEVCKVSATPMLQSGGLFKALSERYALPQRPLENLSQLRRRFEDLDQAGRLPVLLVDDAEQLSVETLADLLNLFNQAVHDGIRLAVVLFAAPPIDALLAQVRQRINVDPTQLMPLQPLDFEQTKALAAHLWEALSPSPDTLRDADLERIFEVSRGLPEAIRNQVELLAGLHADGGVAKSPRKIRLPQLFADVSAPAVIGGVILLVLILLTLIFEDEINALFAGSPGPEETVREVPKTAARIPLPLPGRSLESTAQHAEELAAPRAGTGVAHDTAGQKRESAVEAPEAATQPRQLERTPPVINLPQIVREDSTEDFVTPTPSDAAAEAEPVPAAEIADEPSTPDVEPPTPDTGTESRSPEVVAEQLPPAVSRPERVPAQSAGAAADAAPVTANESVGQKQPAVVSPQVERVTAAPAPPEQGPAPVVERSRPRTPKPAIKTETGVVAAQAPLREPAPVTVGAEIRGERWLMRQQPDNYTLQLLAVSSEAAARGYIDKHGLQNKAAFFRLERSGKVLFPILYGTYANRGAAVAAQEQLPASLASRGAWPRSFASVQAAIK